VAFHVLIAALLSRGNAVRGVKVVKDTGIVVTALSYRAESRQPPLREPPLLHPVRVSVELDGPAVRFPADPLEVMAVTIPANERPLQQTGTDAMLPDARAVNSSEVRSQCNASLRASGRWIAQEERVIVDLRVTPDGRVSAIRVASSSGLPDLDQIAKSCISTFGLFVPRQAGEDDGIASWQRIEWLWKPDG
jgi:TonB family protein